MLELAETRWRGDKLDAGTLLMWAQGAKECILGSAESS